MEETARGGAMRRAVVLGASNVTRAMATVAEAARRFHGTPLDLLVAAGHGRSFGLGTFVLARQLPSILNCGLWRALENRRPAETAVLITDVGNDILYGVLPGTVGDWVERCLDRLLPLASRTVLTQIPLGNLARLSPGWFRVLRRLLFPQCPLALPQVVERLHELAERLTRIAAERGLTLVAQPAAWYGWDPLHHRRRLWPEVWGEILGPWLGGERLVVPPQAHWRNLALRRWRYDEVFWWRWRRRFSQPTRRWPDGSQLSLY